MEGGSYTVEYETVSSALRVVCSASQEFVTSMTGCENFVISGGKN